MRRLALIGSWKRLGIQLGLLAGLGLAFASQNEQPAVAGGRQCPGEGECTFKKPNFMIVLDYSSSMNTDFDGVQTRWQAAVTSIQAMMDFDNGFFDQSMHFGLIRFGHDPDPFNAGTTIALDNSGIVDGQALDVHWYDPVNDPENYFECNGQAIVDFLDNVDDPLCTGMPCSGIGTWTSGGLVFAQDIIAQTRIDHPTDLDVGDERFYANMLITDGLWTSQDGLMQLMPAAENPALPAGDMFDNQDVTTYVVAIGDAAGTMFADEIAVAGGTGAAITPANPSDLTDALQAVLQDIQDDIIIPECTSGLPRIMIVLDASSSMLNVNNMAGAQGTTGWDQARDALVGANSIFLVPVAGLDDHPVEDLVHLGLISYGLEGEELVMVNYGPCMRDNFDWATDPFTSCGAGCVDPWSGPPITWTFLGPGDATYPGFDQDTFSRMPRCDANLGAPGLCTGSGTFTHLGLELAQQNAIDYRNAPPANYPIDANTEFFNILITDGAYAGYSTDDQVATALMDMYANDNTTTYVIGFGDNVSVPELQHMACWGSGGVGVPNCAGGALGYFDAANQNDLEMALQTIIEGIDFDPCCGFNDCSENPEPTTGEADPEPTATDDGGGGTTDASAGSTDDGVGPETGAGTGDTGVVEDTGTPGTTGGQDTGTPDDTAGDDATTAGDDATAGDGGTAGDDATAGDADATAGDDATAGTDPDDSGGGSNSAEDGADNSASATNPTNGDDDDGGSDESDSDTAGENADDGCGCSTDANPPGVLGTFLVFGLAGLARRRRRA